MNLFQDKEFGPELKSIYTPGIVLDKPDKEAYYKTLVWKRLSDLGYSFDLKDESIEPYDVCQGYLGNCYLIAAMSSLAKYPERIIKMFLKSNEKGKHKIKFFVNGEKRDVVIDDFIPYDDQRKDAAFAKSPTKKAWPLLLEKAWAKIHGSYQSSSSGSSEVAFSILSGAPSITLPTKEQDIWKKLMNSQKMQYSVMASTY